MTRTNHNHEVPGPTEDGELSVLGKKIAQKHICQVTDTCYGMTGGTRIDCSCGAYWVVGRSAAIAMTSATEAMVQESIRSHLISVGLRPTEVL